MSDDDDYARNLNLSIQQISKQLCQEFSFEHSEAPTKAAVYEESTTRERETLNGNPFFPCLAKRNRIESFSAESTPPYWNQIEQSKQGKVKDKDVQKTLYAIGCISGAL